MAHPQHIRSRQGIVVPQVKEQSTTFPTQMDVQAGIPERAVDQTGDKSAAHAF